MVDLNDVRARPDVYAKAAKDKRIAIDVKKFLNLDERRRELLAAVETMRAKRNAVSKDVPTLKGKEKDAAIADMKKLGEKLKAQEEELTAAEQEWTLGQYMLPMIPHASVPIGKDDKDNVEASRWGDPSATPACRQAGFGVKNFKDHIALGEALDIIDISRGANVAGSRFYFLKGDGALLHNAVLRYTIDHLTKKGWQLFTPPYLALRDCFVGTGFFPGADENNIYALGDDLHLIGTSEVTVASYHKDEVIPAEELPKRYAGFSPCFRREAGTYGKDTHGLYRVHQFEKVEQVVLCEADEEKGMAMFEEIRTNAEEVLRALELPYRVMTVCTGDMGKGKFFMQDIETWMPSRNAYGETHSCSYLKDFQARRLNIKYTDAAGKKQFVHTLNNTCIASPRILIPILETYQNKDGTVTVPEVLRSYMNGKAVIRKG